MGVAVTVWVEVVVLVERAVDVVYWVAASCQRIVRYADIGKGPSRLTDTGRGYGHSIGNCSC